MNQPRVSIGMPVYNGEAYIREAIDSILAQTFQDFELIISDNASTDRTGEICQEYAAKDQRVRYYRNQQNLGAAPNYNRVFELSRGEYFKWAAHDDLCAPGFLERCVSVLDAMPDVVLCYSLAEGMNEVGEKVPKDCFELNLHFPNPHDRYGHYLTTIFHSGPTGCDNIAPIFGLVRTSALKETGLIGKYLASDLVLLGELAMLGEYHEISEPLILLRQHSNRSMLANRTWQDRLVWFDASAQGKVQLRSVLPTWNLLFEFIASIKRCRLRLVEELLCYLELRKWLLSPFGYRRMLRELKALLTFTLARFTSQWNESSLRSRS